MATPSETIEEPIPEERENSLSFPSLLQQFETALGAKGIELKKQTARQEEVESAQNFAKALAEYFGEMAEKGTFDELKNLNLDERLREVLAVTGEPMPGNFEEESEGINKTITYLEKYERMVKEGQDDEKLRSLAANLRNEGEKILKKRASLLKENLDRIAETRRVELEQINKAGGALDILTAEPRLEKENYEQYKEGFINKIVKREGDISDSTRFEDSFLNRIPNSREKEFWKVIFSNQEGSPEDLSKKIKEVLGILKERGRGKAIEALENLTYRHGGVTKFPAGDFRLPESLNNFLEAFDRSRRAGETLEAAIRLFAEEKLTKIVDIIEKEFASEEERREALEFVKKRYFGKEEPRLDFYSNRVFEIPFLPKEKGEKSKEIPQWIISVAKEVSEFNIFKKIVSYGTYDEGLELMILLNQYLRHKLGENTPCLTSVEEFFSSKGETKVATVKLQLNKSDRGFILDRNLFIKAFSVIDMVNKTGGGFYKFEPLRELFLTLKRKSKEPLPLVPNQFGNYYLTLDRAEDRKLQDNWQEQIVKERERKRPTTREEVMEQIQKEGRYTISTLSEAIKIIELLREDYFRQLATMEAEKAAAEATMKTMEEKIASLEGQLENLRQENKYLRRVLEGIQASKEKLEGENKQLNKLNEALQIIRWTLRNLSGETRKRVGLIEPGGLLGGKAEAKKLREELENTLKVIEALEKNVIEKLLK